MGRIGTSSLALLAACAVASGCGGSASTSPSTSTADRPVALERFGISGELPPGWHLIRNPIPDLVAPRPVFAAATVPASRLDPRGCSATRTLPPGEALVTVIEYENHGNNYPRVRQPLGYHGGHYSTFECSGEGYMFVFGSHGRRLQAHIALDRDEVAPATKAAALEILNGLEFAPRR